MHEFRLIDALRYGLPGGLLVLVAALTYPDIQRTVGTGNGLLEATVLAGASLLIGTVIQTLHRAFVYPVIHRIFLVLYVDGRRPNFKDVCSCYTPCQTELEVIKARWRFAKEHERVADRLAEWGAQAHFLYASAWAVAGGALLPKLAGMTPESRIWVMSLALAVFLAVSGLIHDRRLVLVEGRWAACSGCCRGPNNG